jgi:hypothetical protein
MVDPKLEEAILSGSYLGAAQIPAELYDRATQYARFSHVKEAAKSAAHLKYLIDHPREASDSMSFGTAVHMALLEPDRFVRECVAAPKVDRRTKAGKEIYESFASENVGRLVLSADQFGAVRTIQAKVLANPLASQLLSGGLAEHSLFWVDQATGVRCRARVDYAHMGTPRVIRDPASGEAVVTSYALIDIKTTDKGILPEEFSRTLYNYSY